MTVQADAARAMLGAALEMEKKGGEYYVKAARECENELGRKIFEMLADYETEHIRRIEEIWSALGRGASQAPWESGEDGPDLAGVFRRLAADHAATIQAAPGDVEALNVGLDFESASVRFYGEHLKRASDARERAFLERMVMEERGHLRLLADMRYFYADPEGWFMEKERPTLDGA